MPTTREYANIMYTDSYTLRNCMHRHVFKIQATSKFHFCFRRKGRAPILFPKRKNRVFVTGLRATVPLKLTILSVTQHRHDSIEV